jgi:hypothetical protein
LEDPCLRDDCSLVPRRDVQGTINNRQCLVETTDTLECVGKG